MRRAPCPALLSPAVPPPLRRRLQWRRLLPGLRRPLAAPVVPSSWHLPCCDIALARQQQVGTRGSPAPAAVRDCSSAAAALPLTPRAPVWFRPCPQCYQRCQRQAAAKHLRGALASTCAVQVHSDGDRHIHWQGVPSRVWLFQPLAGQPLAAWSQLPLSQPANLAVELLNTMGGTPGSQSPDAAHCAAQAAQVFRAAEVFRAAAAATI